jgi:hypothetical protein
LNPANPAKTWRPHTVEPFRFAVDFLEGLPVETWRRPGGGGVFQILDGEDSTLFVHWGDSASLEAFRNSLTDLNTRATELTQSPAEVLGEPAHRVSATLEEGRTVAYRQRADGLVTHVGSPATRYRTEAISFARDGVPVLVGYRVTQPIVRDLEEVPRRFLASIRAAES